MLARQLNPLTRRGSQVQLNPAGQIEVQETTLPDEDASTDHPVAENAINLAPSLVDDAAAILSGESDLQNGHQPTADDSHTEEAPLDDSHEVARVIKVISGDASPVSTSQQVNDSRAQVDETFVSAIEESLVANGVTIANGHNDTKYDDFEQVC